MFFVWSFDNTHLAFVLALPVKFVMSGIAMNENVKYRKQKPLEFSRLDCREGKIVEEEKQENDDEDRKNYKEEVKE